MINDVIEDYTDKYIILNKKVINTIEYIDLIIEQLSDKEYPIEKEHEIDNIIQILEIIKEGLK